MATDIDTTLLKNILDNCKVPVETKDEWQAREDHQKYPVIENALIDRLAKTFSKILMYKVSKHLTQRYTVKLNIIDTLRDWSRLRANLKTLPICQDSEKSFNLLIHLIKRYLTPEILSNCDNIDHLIQLAEVILNSIKVKKDTRLKKYLFKVIERIISLDQNERSEKFLLYVVSQSDDLKLGISLSEDIYSNQKITLIEKPLTDCFMTYVSDGKNIEQLNSLNLLFEKITESSHLFQLVSHQLKDMYVKTNRSQQALDFIRIVLEKVQIHCDKYHKDTLDLYPSRLQHCVLLLRMKPDIHTENSKNLTVQSLKKIFLSDYNDSLILMTHFQEWLPEYEKFYKILEDPPSQKAKSEVEMMDCD